MSLRSVRLLSAFLPFALSAVGAFAVGAFAAEPVVLDSVLLTFISDVEAPAPREGLLARVQVHEGDYVAKGQLLAQLDARRLELARERAAQEYERARLEAEDDAEVRFAQKAHEVARAELERAERSIEKFRDSVSKSEIERLQLEVARTDAGLQRARHERKLAEVAARIKATELREAEHDLALTRVEAPFDGQVLEVKRDAGEWVEPGQTITRLVRIDRLRAEGFLDAADLGRVRAGGAARLSVRLPGGRSISAPGKLTFVSPQLDPVNGQFRVWAEFDNPQGALRPGLEARLEIDAASSRD